MAGNPYFLSKCGTGEGRAQYSVKGRGLSLSVGFLKASLRFTAVLPFRNYKSENYVNSLPVQATVGHLGSGSWPIF